MIYTLIFLVATAFMPSSTNEKVMFSVIQQNKKVGEMVGQKSTSADNVTYNCLTTATTRKIVNINVSTEYQVKLQEGKMHTAEAKITVKGFSYAHQFTKYCKENCKSNKNTTITNQTILCTSAMLFFEEPTNFTRVYSELEDKFHPLKHKGNHIYEKTSLEGKVSRYYYQNGKLIKAEIDTGKTNFTMIRK